MQWPRSVICCDVEKQQWKCLFIGKLGWCESGNKMWENMNHYASVVCTPAAHYTKWPRNSERERHLWKGEVKTRTKAWNLFMNTKNPSRQSTFIHPQGSQLGERALDMQNRENLCLWALGSGQKIKQTPITNFKNITRNNRE